LFYNPNGISENGKSRMGTEYGFVAIGLIEMYLLVSGVTIQSGKHHGLSQ
jgi:hypothetical protein